MGSAFLGFSFSCLCEGNIGLVLDSGIHVSNCVLEEEEFNL